LFDLIKIKEEKFEDAFFFGFRNTLVCETLDSATKIAYG
jgi:chromosome segregation ATPase